MSIPEKYDGFTVIPGDEDYDDAQVVFFNLEKESSEGIAINNSSMGDMYHVVLFKALPEIEDVRYDETFEAIFIDPLVYAKRLLPNFYSMFVRKTDKSGPWVENYMRTLLAEFLINTLKHHKENLQYKS